MGAALYLAVSVSFAASIALLMLALRRRHRPAQVPTGPGERKASNRLKALGALLRPGEGEALDALRSRTVRAGLRSRDALDLFLTVRLSLLLVGAGLTLLLVSSASDPLSTILSVSLVIIVAVIGPSWWLDRRCAARQAQVAAALPETLDLWIACLDAGLSLPAALERVATVADDGDVLGQELNGVLDDLQLGVPMEQAFRRFGLRIGSEAATSLATVLIKAMSLGGQISEILRGHGARLRQTQLMELEELAGKANAQLALPLTICLLPAGMLLYFAPAFLALFRNL